MSPYNQLKINMTMSHWLATWIYYYKNTMLTALSLPSFMQIWHASQVNN